MTKLCVKFHIKSKYLCYWCYSRHRNIQHQIEKHKGLWNRNN